MEALRYAGMTAAAKPSIPARAMPASPQSRESCTVQTDGDSLKASCSSAITGSMQSSAAALPRAPPISAMVLVKGESAAVEVEVEETELSAMDSYMLGIDEEDFRENVEKACIYRPCLLSAEQSLCVVVAKSEECAEEIFEEMRENYEWAPCDPARSAVFMYYGKYVLLGKDSAEGAGTIAEAFAEETYGGAKTDFSQNPM